MINKRKLSQGLGNSVYKFVNRSKLVIHANRSLVNIISAWVLGIATILGILPLFIEKDSKILKEKFEILKNNLYSYANYYWSTEAIFFLIIFLIIWLSMIYYQQEVRILKYNLERKIDIQNNLSYTFKVRPKNHYVSLIYGKLGKNALEVKKSLSGGLIEKIDMNIKKYEDVFWISADEIGIIIYEVQGKSESFFMNAILRDKLITEIGDEMGSKFYDNTKFVNIKIDDGETLSDIENKARTEWAILYSTEENIKGKN
ncbi:hypothetical protein [Cyclobacterium salsum]|uniref:hypothetical protein n=1 Tax=Cyclobacterium salsum TaxID=2666329 RepID=UPI0013914F61|nr:hypothetical protein [Cyclobacterium salsum]